ncbi:MAG: hypothetical protein WA064_04030 [Candidatus Moraniibacteriota bacterium]
MDKFNLDQKISSYLAFCFILILSFVVAWKALSVGNTIIENAPNSNAFNPMKDALK